MVKHNFFAVVLSVAILSSYAQPAALEGEMPRVLFSNVVVADSLPRLQLFQNAMKYVASLKSVEEKFELKLKDSLDGKLYGQCTYPVYAQSGILRKLSGTICYQISIEMKDNKYRYHFSDFVFHYYKQDRYYNMVATGKTKSLDESLAAGWQKLWSNHRAFTRSKMESNMKLLEQKMAEDPKKMEKVVAKKVEW